MTKVPGVTLLPGPVLAERTTIRLGGRAVAELLVSSPWNLEAVPGMAASLGGKLVCFGAGSNILARDGDLPLVLVTQKSAGRPEPLREEGGQALVRADAALPLPVLLGTLAAWGLSGLEGLAGIPGSVGGSLAMNAGSYGRALGDTLERVTLFSASLGLVTLPRAALRLGYRRMSVAGHTGFFCIAGVELRLRKSRPEHVRAAMRETMNRKRREQPVTARSAGCVFKNPLPAQSAGRLLDEAGCKGMRVGDMAFSTLHANFLVNLGKGRACDALELLERAAEAVRARHGVRLEREVALWP